MSLNHGSLTTHASQSLPSFAQAFSAPSLNKISSLDNSLPPIQSKSPPMLDIHRVDSPKLRSRHPSEENHSTRLSGVKRSYADVSSNPGDDDSDPGRQSPHMVRVKEEQDMLDESPHPDSPPLELKLPHNSSGAPPPSSVRPSPSKKRRVTISGAPHPLNTDIRFPASENSTPISPVVIGYNIPDDPTAMEQVRSMISIKAQQKVLIEQRRGSVAGILSTATGSTGGSNNPPPSTVDERVVDRTVKSSGSSRPVRRSPNSGMNSGSRRIANSSSQPAPTPRPISPSPMMVPSQQPTQPQQIQIAGHTPNMNTLPPPPISFARRRAGQLGAGKKKPADILISPRDAQTPDQLQPVIQSAPPIPHAGGQGQFYSGRFPMALPRLPPAMGSAEGIQRVVSSHVPPTPTRLSMQNNSAVRLPLPSVPGISGRSPPSASVPIATTLVPPTPNSLHHPGYTGDKSAFLAPFEVFYDALNDSKQLKNWLGEQLQKSTAMMQALTQQQNKLDEIIESVVEKKVVGMRSEIAGLYRRVEELESALHDASSSRDVQQAGSSKFKGKQSNRNGIVGAATTETYTFPPVPSVESASRLRSEIPGWSHDRGDSDADAPRRHSLSASRLEPPREPTSRGTFNVHSPPLGLRDPHGLPPPPPPSRHNKVSPMLHPESLSKPLSERPGMHHQHSLSRIPPTRFQQQRPDSPASGDPVRKIAERATSPSRHRNSIIMSPPDRPSSSTDES